jgi:methionyl-tRNA formyltransferase
VSLDLVFFGTPELARVSLQAVLEAGHRVRAGICQPDRPAGRGRKISSPPVAQACRIWEVDLLQPGSVREPEFLDRIRALKPDLLVTVAFGRILPPELLDIPRIMPLNLHFSLLPALRGAAPYNWALIRGLARTGVSTIRMVSALDAGPVLMQKPTPIGPRETAGELAARLSVLGAELLVETLDRLEKGSLSPQPQDEAQVSLAPPLKPRDGWLDPSRPAREVYDRARGVVPWPGPSLAYGRKRLKVFDLDLDQDPPLGKPGEVVALEERGLKMACAQGHLFLGRVQHPGKRPVTAAQAAGGAGPRPGDALT